MPREPHGPRLGWLPSRIVYRFNDPTVNHIARHASSQVEQLRTSCLASCEWDASTRLSSVKYLSH